MPQDNVGRDFCVGLLVQSVKWVINAVDHVMIHFK